MKLHTNEYYHDIIKCALPQTQLICAPDVLGMATPVFLAKNAQDTIVCKFNDYDIVMHNYKIRKLISNNGLNIPHADIHAIEDTWFESYKYCPDKTLYEHIKNGISKDKIINAYHQAVDIQNTISNIDISLLDKVRPLYYADIFSIIKRYKTNEPLVSIYREIIKTVSRPGTQYLLHCDLNTRNILTNTNGDVTCLIDFDTVALTNNEFALIQMLRTYPFDDLNNIIEYYEDTTHRKLNKKLIINAVKILNMFRTQQIILNKMFQRKNIR